MDLPQNRGSKTDTGSQDSLELSLDLGDLLLLDQVTESFDDLIAREQYRYGPLFKLKECRVTLRPGGTLNLTNTHQGVLDASYLRRQEMLLRVAGFTDMTVVGGSPFMVQAVRRPAVVEEQEYGMVVRELITAREILSSHEFAREYYFYKDYNYDYEVARQFDLHSDVYAVYDKTDEMVALARAAVRSPGYYCPFMYAITEDGSHFRLPERCHVIGEIMAIYKEGKSGVVAYKRLMEFLTQYACHIARADTILTTYAVNDPYTGNYYKSKFMMDEAGVALTYRDFGGKWILLWTDKILELSKLHRDLFKK
ncbi:MAG TPA: hypothetical protein VMU36_12090 [Spirochaetia bacterium]|nr:hypothetical protein [Spirochaetia bacterium]